MAFKGEKISARFAVVGSTLIVEFLDFPEHLRGKGSIANLDGLGLESEAEPEISSAYLFCPGSDRERDHNVVYNDFIDRTVAENTLNIYCDLINRANHPAGSSATNKNDWVTV